MDFVNRSPQYPGRIKLTPVAGTSDQFVMELADGSISGTYKAGTPLNADTLNSWQNEFIAAINSTKLNSIRISDGTNNGAKATISDNQDLTVRLPSIIKATVNGTLNGTASVASKLEVNYGSVTSKTAYIGTSYTTVYSGNLYSSMIILIAPWSGSAKNTAIFGATYADGDSSIDDLSYKNKKGWTYKRWDGRNFQVSMSSSEAAGTYSITIIDAHY